MRPMLLQMQTSINALTEARNKNTATFQKEIKKERDAREKYEKELRVEFDAHLDTSILEAPKTSRLRWSHSTAPAGRTI
jgi:hypothetical protein